MGKGDRKTKRGKITKGTFGVSRRRRPAMSANGSSKPKGSAGVKSTRTRAAKKPETAKVEEAVPTPEIMKEQVVVVEEPQTEPKGGEKQPTAKKQPEPVKEPKAKVKKPKAETEEKPRKSSDKVVAEVEKPKTSKKPAAKKSGTTTKASTAAKPTTTAKSAPKTAKAASKTKTSAKTTTKSKTDDKKSKE